MVLIGRGELSVLDGVDDGECVRAGDARGRVNVAPGPGWVTMDSNAIHGGSGRAQESHKGLEGTSGRDLPWSSGILDCICSQVKGILVTNPPSLFLASKEPLVLGGGYIVFTI